MNREAWLTKLAAKLRPMFAKVGETIPAEVRISVGWPSRRATSTSERRIGECWHEVCSADGHREVFISPTLADPVEVAGVVVHELVHAAGHNGHGASFGKAARALGLTGKMTATTVGPELTAVLAKLVEKIGPYPHAALTPGGSMPKQTTRLIKVECAACGYVVRTTAKWIETGLPTCPCGSEMEVTP